MSDRESRVGVLLLGHGSRDEAASAAFRVLTERFAERHPDALVDHAYLELAAPLLADGLAALASRCSHVIVLPIMLFAAGHVKNDLPLALAEARRRHPGTRFEAARALGVDVGLAAHAFSVAEPLFEAKDRAETALVVVGRGSSDPDANGDFCKMARLIGEGRGVGAVEPCFMGITTPRVEHALDRVARLRPSAIVVAPYLLFAGRLMSRLGDLVADVGRRYPWAPIRLAPPLDVSEPLLAAMDERLRAALSGTAPLPCDSCMYRVPLDGFAEQVGGLRALLYSVRHGVTHTQAAPHLHAHRALRKHVLVCTNGDCADRGSVTLIDELRREIKARGLSREVRVTRTSCLGRCGEGPNVVVYPDGVWYRGVGESDARPIVAEHLAQDRLVAHLVDNVMQ